MRRRLLGGFLSFAILTLVLLEIPFGLSLASSARASALSVIENDGASISVLVSTSLREGDATDAKAILDRFARSNGAIVAVLEHGRLAYSAGAGASEEIADPATKAILRSAAVGRVLGEEGSNDPDDDLLYVAIPVSVGSPDAGGPAAGDRPGGVLLVAEPSGALHSRIGSIREELLVFGGAMLAIAAAIGYLLAGSLTSPLARIRGDGLEVRSGSASRRSRRAGPRPRGAAGPHHDRQPDGRPDRGAAALAAGVRCRRVPPAPHAR